MRILWYIESPWFAISTPYLTYQSSSSVQENWVVVEEDNNHIEWNVVEVCCCTPLIARIMGPTWGPPGSCRPQMGPMLAPWTLLSGSRCNASIPGGSRYHMSIIYHPIWLILHGFYVEGNSHLFISLPQWYNCDISWKPQGKAQCHAVRYQC